MKNVHNYYNSSVGFFGLLGIVFIVLRLFNVINWPWWVVLLPIYGVPLFTIAIMLTAFICMLLWKIIKELLSKED